MKLWSGHTHIHTKGKLYPPPSHFVSEDKDKREIMDGSDYSQYYFWTAINNEKCIVLHFPNDVNAVKRKSIKDTLGQCNLNTIKLDTRPSKQTKVPCDEIAESEKISKWVNNMISLYSSRGLQQETADLSGDL